VSELQIALLLLAVVLLGLLFGYNKWQERRALQRLDSSLRSGVGDALLEPAPVMPKEPVGGDLPAAPAGGRIEPRLGALTEEPIPPAADGGDLEARSVPSVPASGAEREGAFAGWIEDPLLDCVFELRCTHAVDGVTVLDAVAGLHRQAFALPVHVAAWDARAQQWVHPDRFGFYSEMLVAIQLANRRMALDDVEASRFLAAVQQIAVALDADFDAPEVPRIVDQANRLREQCGQFDVQIGLTLEGPGGPWTNERLAAVAAKAELVSTGPGTWRRLDAAGMPLFTFGSATAAKDRLSLELDVPLAPVASQPLRMMFAAASVIALDLEVQIVDDNGRAVDAASLARVEEQLEALYAQMHQAGYEPGSPRALRLYA
jgi:hypothetical protein